MGEGGARGGEKNHRLQGIVNSNINESGGRLSRPAIEPSREPSIARASDASLLFINVSINFNVVVAILRRFVAVPPSPPEIAAFPFQQRVALSRPPLFRLFGREPWNRPARSSIGEMSAPRAYGCSTKLINRAAGKMVEASRSYREESRGPSSRELGAVEPEGVLRRTGSSNCGVVLVSTSFRIVGFDAISSGDNLHRNGTVEPLVFSRGHVPNGKCDRRVRPRGTCGAGREYFTRISSWAEARSHLEPHSLPGDPEPIQFHARIARSRGNCEPTQRPEGDFLNYQ